MNLKSIVIGIVLLGIGIGSGYYFASHYKLVPASEPAPTPTIDETSVIIAVVKAALIAKHGPDAGNLKITISKLEGNYAQGGASAQGGGGMWFAAKVNGTWKLVWDGNGTISCADIDPYNFPNTMIPECWNETTRKSIAR